MKLFKVIYLFCLLIKAVFAQDSRVIMDVQDHQRVDGALHLVGGQSFGIVANVGGREHLHLLDTQSTYSQLPKNLAVSMDLRGHKKLLGISYLPDSYMRVDYLAKGNITVAGLTYPVVFRVGSSQEPVLLGVDFIVSSGMNLNMSNMTYSVHAPAYDPLNTSFRRLDFDVLMRQAGLKEEDLVPFDQLHDANDAHTEAIRGGYDHLCVNTGAASGGSSAVRNPAVWLGYSY